MATVNLEPNEQITVNIHNVGIVHVKWDYATNRAIVGLHCASRHIAQLKYIDEEALNIEYEMVINPQQ